MPQAWIFCYDIAAPQRLRRVRRCLSAHATPLQQSVFWFHGTDAARDKCLEEVVALIDASQDDLRCYAVPARTLLIRSGRGVLPEGVFWSALPGHGWRSLDDVVGEADHAWARAQAEDKR